MRIAPVLWILSGLSSCGGLPPLVEVQAAPPAAAQANAAESYLAAFDLLKKLDEGDVQRLGLCNADGCWVVTTPLDCATNDLVTRQKQAIILARAAAIMPEAGPLGDQRRWRQAH